MRPTIIILAFICLLSIKAALANSDFSGTGDIYDMAIEFEGDAKATAFVSVRRTNKPAENLNFVAEMLETEEIIAFEKTDQAGVYSARMTKKQIVESMILMTLGDGDTEVIELKELKPAAALHKKAEAPVTSGLPPFMYALFGAFAGMAAMFLFKRQKLAEVEKVVMDESTPSKQTKDKASEIVAGVLMGACIGFLNPAEAFAGAGHSHVGDDHGDSGFGVGEVMVAKRAQFILGIRTMEVRPQDQQVITKKLGVLRPRQEDVVKIKAPLSGVFKKIANVKIGRQVKKGQLLGYVLGTARVRITAPIDGVLADMHGVEGERVDPDHDLMRIVNTKKLWAEVDLFQSDIAKIVPGSKVNIDIKGFGTFASEVVEQLFEVNPNTSTVKVLLEIDNAEAILPLGAAVTAYLPTSESKKALAVPRQSLMNLSGSNVVFVKTEAETFVHRVVKVSKTVANDHVIITKGLKDGDVVVIEGNYQLLTASN